MSDVDLTAIQLARTTRGLCRSTDLAAAGVDHSTISRRVARGVWARPLPGVVDTTRATWDWSRRAQAAVLACPVGTLASHRTAARLHGLPGFDRVGALEVMTPRAFRNRGLPVTVHSTLRPEPGLVVDGIPVTGGPRTALALAVGCPERPFARAVRELLRRGLLVPDDVVRPSLRGLPGLARLRAAVEAEWSAALDRTDSVLEDDVLDLLRARGFAGWTTQHRLELDDDGHVRIDVAWPRHRLAVEVLGARWHADSLSRLADAARRDALEKRGWRVVEVRVDDLHGAAADRFVDRLRTTLAASSQASP